MGWSEPQCGLAGSVEALWMHGSRLRGANHHSQCMSRPSRTSDALGIRSGLPTYDSLQPPARSSLYALPLPCTPQSLLPPPNLCSPASRAACRSHSFGPAPHTSPRPSVTLQPHYTYTTCTSQSAARIILDNTQHSPRSRTVRISKPRRLRYPLIRSEAKTPTILHSGTAHDIKRKNKRTKHSPPPAVEW